MARDPDLGWAAVPLQTGRRLRPVTPVHVRGDMWTCRRHRVKTQAVRGGQSSGRVPGRGPGPGAHSDGQPRVYSCCIQRCPSQAPSPLRRHSEPSGAGRGNSLF